MLHVTLWPWLAALLTAAFHPAVRAEEPYAAQAEDSLPKLLKGRIRVHAQGA